MESATPRNLKPGDQITFGVYTSKFRVQYEPLVICSSCLNGSEKSSLTKALQLLGGHIVNNWTEKCTHLVMTSVKVTIKTICALICCRSIVKPEYFSDMIKAIQNKQALPAAASFLPIIDEPSLQSESLEISPNAKRKTIFKDKTFLFLSAKQHKKLSSAVQFGGGKARLLTGELDDHSLLENPTTCVIDVGTTDSQQSESQTPAWITSLLDTVQSKGLRAIPEAEIGLAVMYMSTETCCNPQHRAATRNENVNAARSSIIGSTLSCSLAVNETVLPPTTFNTTAYVANTEQLDPPDNWMEISGVREVKETPKSLVRNGSKQDAGASGDSPSGISGDCRAALFPEDPKTTEVKRPRVPPTDTTTSQKEKSSQKMGSSNKIQNYFQPVTKKRDREDESELFTAKVARRENGHSQRSNTAVDLFSGKQKKTDKMSSIDMDFDTEPNDVSKDKSDFSSKWSSDKEEAATSTALKEVSMKRKEPDDDVVEESDLESDREVADQDQRKQKDTSVTMKRRRVDLEGDFESGKSESQEKKNDTKKSDPKMKTELVIKQEPESSFKDKKTPLAIGHLKEETDDGIPRRLLLSEFRSLVVSRPVRDNPRTANANHGNGPNFKKFRKVAFPGAGNFPRIIGGSDLFAHNKKKNSELEQWLRQEMEEQTQQAREQSLAEDLFRYNPKTMKRRR
ncbi:nibrin isoform X2 [Hyperolius riggenbachi]